MNAMRYVFGAIMLLVLAGTAFAAAGDVFAPANLNQSQIYIMPASEADPATINISVVSFESPQSPAGTAARDKGKEWTAACTTECEQKLGDCQYGNVQTCIDQKAAKYNSGTTSQKVTRTYLKNANVSVYYFGAGSWILVPGCENLQTNIRSTAYLPDNAGTLVPFDYYYAQCNLSAIARGRQTTNIRVAFPQTATVAYSSENYQVSNANVTTATIFATQLQDFIARASQSGGVSCVSAFLIMGLLLASLYFAGKSPISLLDITTPRLPAPKGVTASGQILAPFGYTEMKRTTMDKMNKAANLAGIMGGNMGKAHMGDAGYNKILRDIDNLKWAQGSMVGDINQNKKMAKAIVTAGKSMGMSNAELEKLVKLPYHYGEAEHKTVAKIMDGLGNAADSRSRLMGMTLKDYLLGQRTYQSLEVLTAQPDVGKRSMVHSALTGTVGKFYGANRYAVLGGAVMPGIDSTVRSGRIAGRFAKGLVTEAPGLARGVARTTMELVGGRNAIEELGVKARTSATAAWVHGQLTKHPSEVKVGKMFPINDKMAHLYRTLHNETLSDQMRYVLKQIYRKQGVRFDISEEEMATMGHVDMDILKRSGYAASAELAEVENEIRRVLSNSAMSSVDKLNALTRLAESHGAHIDHQMTSFSARVQEIEHSAQPDHLKMVLLQQALEEQSKVRTAATRGGRASDDAYYCHVGGDTVKGAPVWETMVLRTMVWDGMNGYLNGGIREELVSARLNIANRLTTLHPEEVKAMLPEYMRNDAQLKAVAQRNKSDIISLFTNEGRQTFQQVNGKSMEAASIADIVSFMKGGAAPRTGQVDPKTGRMVWYAADIEHGLPQNATLVDVKRHWLAAGGMERAKETGVAIGGWVEGRFSKSYIPAMKQSIEAELDRMPGSSGWTVEERAQQAKKLWVLDQLKMDMENRFNSQFGNNAYGTTRETTRFYAGVVAGFMEKALEEKGLASTHPDVMALKAIDVTSTKDLAKLSNIMRKYEKEYNSVAGREMSYDDIAKSNRAVIMTHEGGYVYYREGMMTSDYDRIMAGETAIRDAKGQKRAFIPEDIPIRFQGRDDLMQQYAKARSSENPADWQPLMDAAKTWMKEGGGDNYDRRKVVGHLAWQFGLVTHDYESRGRLMNECGISVEASRNVMPTAPSALKQFGYEGVAGAGAVKAARNVSHEFLDYITKVSLYSGGSVHKTSYDITPISSQLRMHSDKFAFQIMSGEALKGLTKEEQAAARAAAMSHGAYLQVWQYAIDRNPWKMSSSFGTSQSYESMFHMGPSLPFQVSDNLKAYMSKGEYNSFMALYGFPMDFAGKLMRPYINMMRGMQMSMQGYGSSHDQTQDQFRQWDSTKPRFGEALQSLNPFSSRWTASKTSERIAGLNVVKGSLEAHELAGAEYMSGLRQGPSHLMLKNKGVYANARTFDVNPGETIAGYRGDMHADTAMAEYLFRQKEAVFMHDKEVYADAMNNTTRRTASAEYLAIRRTQERSSLTMLANPINAYGSAGLLLWHAPFLPPSLSPRDMVAKWVGRAKQGGGGSIGDSIRRTAEGITQGVGRMTQPHKMHMQKYCSCGASGYRGTQCRNCRKFIY